MNLPPKLKKYLDAKPYKRFFLHDRKDFIR